MPRHAQTYTVQDATGTAKELYAWITAGMNNPPSEVAFEARLKRGDREVGELRRPARTLSAKGRSVMVESARRIGRAGNRKRQEEKKEVQEPAMITERMTKEIKLVRGSRYFRPGSLDAWPELKILEAA